MCKRFYFVLRLCFLIEIYKAAMVWLIVYRLFVRGLNFLLLGFLIGALPLSGLFILSFLKIVGFLILCDSNDLVWLWFLSIVLWCLLPLFSNNWYHSLLQYHDCITCWLGFRIKANCFLGVSIFCIIVFIMVLG